MTTPSGRETPAAARRAARPTCRAAAPRRRPRGRPHLLPTPRRGRSRSRSGRRRSRPRPDGATRASTRRAPRGDSPHSAAITSAERPCGTICQRSSSLSERSPPFDPIGTRDIISTPAETTTSSCPAQTAAAALKFDCMDEPHWRSTLVPHTVSGQPATSGAMRPMFQPCSPICVTQPICTSSTSAGSRSWRSTRPFSTWPGELVAAGAGQDAVPLADRRADGVDDERVGAHADSIEPPGSQSLHSGTWRQRQRSGGS